MENEAITSYTTDGSETYVQYRWKRRRKNLQKNILLIHLPQTQSVQ